MSFVAEFNSLPLESLVQRSRDTNLQVARASLATFTHISLAEYLLIGVSMPFMRRKMG